MIPPRKDPTRKHGPPPPTPAAGTPSRPQPVGKPTGNTSKMMRPGTPPPAAKPTGNTSKMMRRGAPNNGRPGTPPAGKPAMKARPASSPQMRRAPATAAGPRAKGPNVKMIAVIASVVIVALIGGILAINSGKKSNEEIQKELRAELAKAEAIPDIVKREEEYKRLQAVPEYAKATAGSVRADLDRLESETSGPAKLQGEADDKVAAFMQKLPSMDALTDLATANRLYDEASALYQQYSTTTWGDKLKKAVDDLRDWIEKHQETSSATSELIPTTQRAEQCVKGDAPNFKQAREILDKYEAKWKGKGLDEVAGKVKEARDKIERALKSFVEKCRKDAEDMVNHGQGEQARAMLQKALPGLAGTDGYNEIKDAIKKIH